MMIASTGIPYEPQWGLGILHIQEDLT